MSGAGERRRGEANRIIDEALRGGISFMFDDDGRLMRWQALPDIDPGPCETYERLCVEIDRLRRDIIAELRSRLPRNGEVLMGAPLLDADEPPITKESIERAWANRAQP